MEHDPSHGTELDGNAAAGVLVAAFGTDMTAARGQCASCGADLVLGEVSAWLGGPGTVLRCRGCFAVLVVLVEHHDLVCVDLRGLSALEPPHPDRPVGA